MTNPINTFFQDQKRFTRILFIIGIASIIGTCIIGTYSYIKTKNAYMDDIFHRNLNLTKTYSKYVDAVEESRKLKELSNVWKKSDKPEQGSYMCVINKGGFLNIHTARPDTVGENVGFIKITPRKRGDPSTLQELINVKSSWVGYYTALDGQEQITSFVYNKNLKSLIAIHVPLDEIESQFIAINLPWILGLSFITLVVLPLSLLALYYANKSHQKTIRVAHQNIIDANNQLVVNNRELMEYAAVASHDLQEPLRKVQVFGEKILKSCEDSLSPDGKDYLQRILKSTQRMSQLITDLLTLAKIPSLDIQLIPIDLNQLIKDIQSDLEVLIEKNHGIIHVKTLPTINGNPTQIKQLFQNMITNALKFHKKDEYPEINIYQIDDHSNNLKYNHHYQIVIEDNGIGIEEKYIERIFGLFQRLHDRVEYEGTGIGLSICRKIMDIHKGSIKVESNLGIGSKFILQFQKNN